MNNSPLINFRPSSFSITGKAAVVVVHVVLAHIRKKRLRRTRKGWICINRQRRSVLEIRYQLGDPYFRRAYRMSYNSFCHLAALLSKGIMVASGQNQESSSELHHVHNGRIMPEVRLASAIKVVCWWLIIRYHDDIWNFTFGGI